MRRPSILILDESTSALDTINEKQIMEGMKPLLQSCTSFIIAHRLSTIANADIIVVLEKGKVVTNSWPKFRVLSIS